MSLFLVPHFMTVFLYTYHNTTLVYVYSMITLFQERIHRTNNYQNSPLLTLLAKRNLSNLGYLYNSLPDR